MRLYRSLKLPRFRLFRERQARVDAAKRDYAALPTTKLVRKIASLKRQKFQLATAEKTLNLHYEALAQLLRARLDDEELEKLETRSGIVVAPTDVPYATVVDLPRFFRWVKRTRSTYMLGYKWQVLNAFCKERIVLGHEDEVPDGVRVFKKSSVSVRGVRGVSDEEDDGG